MRPPGYMNVREAARRYGVSRAKIHRLIRLGRLPTTKDPRDERATLVREEDLDRLLRFPAAYGERRRAPLEVRDRGNLTVAEMYSVTPREVGGDPWARIDALRLRVAARGRVLEDSTEIIREERERRSRELDRPDLGSEEGRNS